MFLLTRIVQKFYKKGVLPILGLYQRRRSQYLNTGKIALCCIAKMENEYIRFFVEYYHRLHFDKIFLYDNNDPEGEYFEDVIGDYISTGFVEVTNYRGREVAQLSAYQNCYERHCKEYDWIAFLDCDEFLTFACSPFEIHEFLSQKKFRFYQVIHINWKVYGDNEMLDSDGRDIIDRLTTPIPVGIKYKNNEHCENEHVKSLIRGGLTHIFWLNSPHTPTSNYYHCCNPEGIKVDVNSPFMPIDHRTLFIRHYSTKTIGEWVRNKMQKGLCDRPEERWKEDLSLDTFFLRNTKTEKKVSYAEKVMRELGHNA